MHLKDKELAAELAKWLNKYANKPNTWSRTETGKLIKDTLLVIGNWKNKRRGNPVKGYRMRGKNNT